MNERVPVTEGLTEVEGELAKVGLELMEAVLQTEEEELGLSEASADLVATPVKTVFDAVGDRVAPDNVGYAKGTREGVAPKVW